VKDVTIVRLESIYPFNRKELGATIKKVKAKDVMWVQEEPINQGAYSFVRDRIVELLPAGKELLVASRPGAASPAVGTKKKYEQEYAELMDSAFLPTETK
jgi:2-oxoglutarate dehydrogenase E1 component